MALDLSPPLSTYFDASNAHDADSLVAAFSDQASVHDEGRTMVGSAAIRGWAEETFSKYRTILTPRTANRQGDAIVVGVDVAGSFPGSPITLDFRFHVEGARIGALEIA